MNRQHGFTVHEFVLALVITAAAAAVTVPPLISLIERTRQQSQLVTNVNEVFKGASLALTDHWQKTQCRGSPVLGLADLIRDYHVPSSVRQSPWPLGVAFNVSSLPPHTSTRLTVTVTTPTADNRRVAAWLAAGDNIVTTDGKHIRASRSTQPITSLLEQANYNPDTGCMEAP